MSAGLRKLIRSDTDIAMLREQALKEGMRPLRIAAVQKVHAGLTTLEEVMGVATHAE
jgi:general secretion pathway protein E